MLALPIVVALLAPASSEQASDWVPSGAPAPTAWARAGARGWRLCDDLGRQAAARRLGGVRGKSLEDEVAWRRRAQQCPHEPEVLMLGAQGEVLESARLPFGEQGSVDDLVKRHRAGLRAALVRVDAAIAESKRRGVPAPTEAYYYRAYVSVGLGRYGNATEALAKARAIGDVEGWRSDYMEALVALLEGQLERALRLAHRSVLNVSSDDRVIARYIWALVLDRAGAPAAATEQLISLRRESPSLRGRVAVESVLPIHERLYLRAIDFQANRDRENARRMWTLYLERPEPEPPERELARRHRAELNNRPAAVF